MRAAFQRILKYSPTVLLTLLALAWAAELFGRLGVTYSLRQGPSLSFESTLGTLGLWHHSAAATGGQPFLGPQDGVEWLTFKKRPPGFRYAGIVKTTHHAVCTGGFVTGVQVPVPVVATVCLPVALGALLSFRFRLWHYLAYTALVAAELAFYLRWAS